MKQTAAFSLRNVRTFAHEHDDLPAFHAAYLVLTFLAASMFHLGFFAALIVAHMCLDIVKYREVHGLRWSRVVEGVVRESLVDITLFLLGLVIAVYLHPSLMIFQGMQKIMLAEVTIARGIGVVTPKLKILYKMLRIVGDIDHYLSRMHRRFGKKMNMVEYVCSFAIIIAVGMLLLAPVLLMMEPGQYQHILRGELTPWRL